jgi:hypothetical protein
MVLSFLILTTSKLTKRMVTHHPGLTANSHHSTHLQSTGVHCYLFIIVCKSSSSSTPLLTICFFSSSGLLLLLVFVKGTSWLASYKRRLEGSNRSPSCCWIWYEITVVVVVACFSPPVLLNSVPLLYCRRQIFLLFSNNKNTLIP